MMLIPHYIKKKSVCSTTANLDVSFLVPPQLTHILFLHFTKFAIDFYGMV